jgi:hypothetical protein
MPLCPDCGTDYSSRRKKCPDCGSLAVKGPGFTEPIELQDRNWIIVRRMSDSEEAEALKSFLESKGFSVTLQRPVKKSKNGHSKKNGKSSSNGNGSKNGNSNPLYILVPLENAPRAASIIKSGNGWLEDESHELREEDLGIIEDAWPSDFDDEPDLFDSDILDSYKDYSDLY